jgi:hypothetical protein
VNRVMRVHISQTADQKRYLVRGGENGTLHEINLALTQEVTTALTRLYERKKDRVHRTLEEQDEDSKIVGSFLFDRVFGEAPFVHEFRARFQPGAETAQLSLYLPQSLYALPWELLIDEEGHGKNQFLSLHHSLVRYDDQRRVATRFRITVPSATRRYLYVHADTNDLNTGKAEPGATESVHFTYQYPGIFDAFNEYASKERQRNVKTDAFIFLGHGVRSETPPLQSSLIFVRRQSPVTSFLKREQVKFNDPRNAVLVGTVLAKCKDLNFAMVLACESAWNDPTFPFHQSIVGTILSETSIPILLGTQCRIGAQAALQFLDHFLGRLHATDDEGEDGELAPGEKRFDELVTSARWNLRASMELDGKFPTALDWWIPVLYAQEERLIVTTTSQEEILPAVQAERI